MYSGVLKDYVVFIHIKKYSRPFNTGLFISIEERVGTSHRDRVTVIELHYSHKILLNVFQLRHILIYSVNLHGLGFCKKNRAYGLVVGRPSVKWFNNSIVELRKGFIIKGLANNEKIEDSNDRHTFADAYFLDFFTAMMHWSESKVVWKNWPVTRWEIGFLCKLNYIL